MSRAVVGTTVLVVTALAVAAGSVANHIYNNFLEKKKKEDTEVKAANIIPKRVIRAILFDMDGTLLESAEIWFELLRACVAHFGHPELTYDRWKSTFGQSMAKNVELFMPGTDQALVDKYCFDNYGQHLHKMYILDGAVDALRFANEAVGGRTCIVTNCPRPITAQILSSSTAETLLETLSLKYSYPHNVICADDIVEISELHYDSQSRSSVNVRTSKILPKPKHDMVLEAARRLGVDPSECLLVGDSKYDMQCINNADGVGVGIQVEGGAFHISSISEIVYLSEYLDFQLH